MKSKAILASVVIASLGLSSVSYAQGWERDGNRDGRQFRNEQRGERHDERRGERHDERRMGNRGDWREHGEQQRYFYGARGPEWRRGGFLPNEYRNHQYVVDDWRGHRLSRPPRGYQWVQVGNDYVLAAVATGLIANLILNQ
jgi:Ni/Co efflux regulator RcnB